MSRLTISLNITDNDEIYKKDSSILSNRKLLETRNHELLNTPAILQHVSLKLLSFAGMNNHLKGVYCTLQR